MLTQTLARLVIATALLALLGLLLFSGTIASAAKADKLAPTTPTNLVVTAITENTVSLRWNPSTDNSGKFSYRVKINDLNRSSNLLATVSQTQTTYTVQYLVPFGSYSFGLCRRWKRQSLERQQSCYRRHPWGYHTSECSSPAGHHAWTISGAVNLDQVD